MKMEHKKHVFSPMEKKFFVGLVRKYTDIVENKDTDSSTLMKKNEAWHNITAEYNSSPVASKQATIKQLRRLWMNMKQRKREALIKARLENRMTNGRGPFITEDSINPVIHQTVPGVVVGVEESHGNESEIIQGQNIQTSAISQMRLIGLRERSFLLEKEYKDRQTRASQKHDLEMKLLEQQIREAAAKAELAELNTVNERHELEMRLLHHQVREATAKADLAELILNSKKEMFTVQVKCESDDT